MKRDAILLIEASKGQSGAAKALVRQVLKACDIPPTRDAKNNEMTSFWVLTAKEAKSYNLNCARFTIINCDDETFSRVMKTGNEMAQAQGWNMFPVDAYHD